MNNYTAQWVVYQNDFEIGAGDEWTISTTNRTPTGRGFLGEFGNTPTCLNLQNLPRHNRVTVAFDLYIIRSWDGNQITRLASWLSSLQAPSHIIGPDVWWIKVDGSALLNTTFTNWDLLGFRQAYPDGYPGGDQPARTGTVENNTLGYVFGPYMLDSVYRLDFPTFSHQSSTMQICFSGSGLQDITDESWGLDNIIVIVYAPTFLSSNR